MWIVIILFLFCVTIILSSLNVYLNVNSIITRKVFHIIICLVSLYNSLLYEENLKIFIVPCIFVFCVLFIKQYKIMPFIRRIEEKNGDVWLSVIILINSFFIYFNIIDSFVIYIYYLILGFGDGVSGISPLIFEKRLMIKNGKSINGCSLFFLFSFLILLLFNNLLYNIPVYKVIVLCFSSALIEFLSNRLSDNLLIYLNILFFYYFI